MFAKIKLSTRVYALAFLGAVGLVMVFAVALFEFKQDMLTARKAKLQNLVEYAHTQLAYYDEQARSGALTLEQAQTLAKESLRKARYDGNEYFWLNDLQPKSIMHPIRPQLEGKDQSDNKDPAGKPIYLEFVKMVKNQGSGFVDYVGIKPETNAVEPKLSFVQLYAPWGWVIGTGVYMDDIEANFRAHALKLGGIGLLVLLVSVTLSVLITRSVVTPLALVAGDMDELARGRVDVRISGTERADEIGDMARSLDTMQSNLAVIAGAADQIAQGNLTVGIEPRSEGDQLGIALKTMLVQLRSLVAETANTARAVHDGASTISTSVKNQATASSELSSSVAQITSTMEELSASASQISEHSGTVVDIANSTLDSSRLGAEAMEQLAAHMESIRDENRRSLDEIIGLGNTSKEISKVMTIINTIADQTKLIAFNAALEAASAGESGRRFSVVAAEIRRLADSVTESTGEIESKVSEIQDSISRLVLTSEKGASGIDEGMEASASTAGRLSELVEAASRTASAAQQISLSTQQQKTAVNQVVIALREIASTTHHTSQSMSQLSEVSHKMETLSSDMDEQVGCFRLSDERNVS